MYKVLLIYISYIVVVLGWVINWINSFQLLLFFVSSQQMEDLIFICSGHFLRMQKYSILKFTISPSGDCCTCQYVRLITWAPLNKPVEINLENTENKLWFFKKVLLHRHMYHKCVHSKYVIQYFSTFSSKTVVKILSPSKIFYHCVMLFIVNTFFD